MSQRRLPIYILLDCSESMIGEAIESVQRGVDMLIRQLRSDPQPRTAHVSIITYHGTAQQIVPLTDLSEVQTPQLSVQAGDIARRGARSSCGSASRARSARRHRARRATIARSSSS